MQEPTLVARFEKATEEASDVLVWWEAMLSGSFEMLQRGRAPLFSSGPVSLFYTADIREWVPLKAHYPGLRPVPGSTAVESAGPFVVQFAPRSRDLKPFELFEVTPRWDIRVTESRKLGVRIVLTEQMGPAVIEIRRDKPAGEALEELGCSLRSAWFHLRRSPVDEITEANSKMDSAVRKVDQAKGVRRRVIDAAENAKRPKTG